MNRIKYYFLEGLPPRSNFKKGLAGTFQFLSNILENNPPALRHFLKIQPLTSLITSIICIMLMRRGLEFAPVAAVWGVLTLIYVNIRFVITNVLKIKIAPKIADFLMMFIISNSLFFITPLYYESATIMSRNVIFLIILGILNIIINWYKGYFEIVIKNPFTGSIFYALVFFSIFNLLLPVLTGLQNSYSIIISEIIGCATMIIFIYPYIIRKNKFKNKVKFIGGIIISFIIIWFCRSVIPPAPLKLSNSTACMAIHKQQPVDPFKNKKDITEAYYYSAIFAPYGIRETIYHVWKHNGNEVLKVKLPISGGRNKGFRTWSKHTLHEGTGNYTVEIWTEGGQYLGSGGFKIY